MKQRHSITSILKVLSLNTKPLAQALYVLRLLLSMSVLFWPIAGLSVQSDNQAPIEIQADSATLSETAQTATYSGNVQLTQGTLNIHCEQLVIYNSETGVARVEAKGVPATYSQKVDPEKPILNAQAQQITYLPAEERIQLIGAARITQGGNVFEGQQIDYNIKTQVLMASSQTQAPTGLPATGGERQRVKMTLQPQTAEKKDSQN